MKNIQINRVFTYFNRNTLVTLLQNQYIHTLNREFVSQDNKLANLRRRV